MALEIKQEQHGSVKVLALSGRLDTETSADLELAVQDLFAAAERHFLVDLTSVSYVSSAGLRVLLMLAKQVDSGKGSMRLSGLSEAVKQVFEVAGFTKLFVIFPNRAAALASHPEAKPDPVLAKAAATLMGAEESPRAPSKDHVEIARSAAQLLGAGADVAAAKAKPESPRMKPSPASKTPAPAAPAIATNAESEPGLIGKLRNLFGGKR